MDCLPKLSYEIGTKVNNFRMRYFLSDCQMQIGRVPPLMANTKLSEPEYLTFIRNWHKEKMIEGCFIDCRGIHSIIP